MKPSLLAMPLAALALAGAAPPPALLADIAGAAECRLTQIGAEYAYRTLTVTGTEEDEGEGADDDGTLTTFDPAGAKVLGGAAESLLLAKYPKVQRYEAVFAGDYAKAKAALLAAHGVSKCDSEVGPAGGRTCEIKLPAKGEWQRTLRLFDGGGTLQTTCVYSKG